MDYRLDILILSIDNLSTISVDISVNTLLVYLEDVGDFLIW